MLGQRGGAWRLSRLLLLGALVVVLGDLSIHLAPAGTEVAAWWPAAGLAVVVGVRAGADGLAPVVLVTWLASVVANVAGGRDPGVSLLFATANSAEVLVTSLAVLAWNPMLSLQTLRRLVVTSAAAALGALCAGLLAGLTVSWLLDGGLWVTVRAVTASHLSAVLLFLPFGMHRSTRPSAGRAEVVLTGTVLVVATLVVFGPSQSLPTVFLVFPLLVLVAFRQSVRECAVQLILVSTTATVASAAGWGPLFLAVERAGLPPETVGTLLQLLIASAAMTVYAIRAVVDSQTEALLTARRARRHLDAVIESAPSTAIVQTDLDGVVRVFNRGAVNLLGYDEDEVVGHATPALFHDADELAARAADLGVAPGYEAVVHQVRLGHRGSERRDWTFVTADGTRRLVSQVVSRVDDVDGLPIGFLGIAEDVGAQRQVEHLLVQALEQERALAAQLREADQLKSDFVSSVSHELRTPMTSVLGYAEVLADQYAAALGPEGHDLLDRIESNGRRLLALVDDLLTLSRLESGAMTIEERPFDLNEVARNAAAVVRPLAEDRGLTLRVREPDRAATVVGDGREMERVVVNLLTNAVKFTPEGGRVQLAVELREPDTVLVRVSDTGVGIPPEDLDQVFTRFHRASNAIDSAVQGTGLGLAIVKAIVERHGGSVSVASQLSRGTTFTLTLPRHHHQARSRRTQFC